jgi:hypothetical protein
MQKIVSQQAPDPGRHHVGTQGDIISECPGDFVGIRRDLSLSTFCGTDSTFYNPPFITSERGLAQAEAALIAIARAGLPGLILAGGGPLGRRR